METLRLLPIAFLAACAGGSTDDSAPMGGGLGTAYECDTSRPARIPAEDGVPIVTMCWFPISYDGEWCAPTGWAPVEDAIQVVCNETTATVYVRWL